jgi:5-methyltetrahydrofolate corrinoid/iron sulfur protein methyltransferase
MYIIGENIHIISPSVKAAVAEKDAKFFQDTAVRMVEAGANAIDLNIGPQKKRGHGGSGGCAAGL